MITPQGLPSHLEFHFGFVRDSILLALFAGFAIAAHLAFTIGFDFQMSKGFYAFRSTDMRSYSAGSVF